MTRSELVQRLADTNPQLYAKDCEAVVDAILARISDAIAAGDRVAARSRAGGCHPSHSAMMAISEKEPASAKVPATANAIRSIGEASAAE